MAGKTEGQNEYERAFEGWLSEQQVRFARVDQTHRCVLNDAPAKTFDYLIYPEQDRRVLVELKGRIFRGASLAGRSGLQCWVFAEDVAALGQWQERFEREGTPAEAVFVFAYRVEKIAVEYDGLGVYDYAGRRYVFLSVRHEDYQRCLKRRSRRWKTVTLSADDFRTLCFPTEQCWLGNGCCK